MRHRPNSVPKREPADVLIGLYTGTRPGAILSLHWEPNRAGGWIDLDAGIIHRRN